MKRIARISSAAAAIVGAVLVVMTGASAWSQTRESAATTQPRQGQERVLAGEPGDRAFRGSGGERRFEGRGDGMRPPPPPPQPRGMEWRRGDFRPENFSEPTSEEWEKVEAFMKKHSPERFQRLAEIGDDERQRNVRRMFADRYRTLQELKEQDPELYQIRLQRMPIEDKVFELSWQLSRKAAEKPEDAKSQLRAQLRLLIKNRFEERAARIRRMEKRLKEDEQRMDEFVEANLRDIADEEVPRDLRPQLTPSRRERRNVEATPTDANATPTTGE